MTSVRQPVMRRLRAGVTTAASSEPAAAAPAIGSRLVMAPAASSTL
jgi:hypothetical protein